jgi:hypothetical protein
MTARVKLSGLTPMPVVTGLVCLMVAMPVMPGAASLPMGANPTGLLATEPLAEPIVPGPMTTAEVPTRATMVPARQMPVWQMSLEMMIMRRRLKPMAAVLMEPIAVRLMPVTVRLV